MDKRAMELLRKIRELINQKNGAKYATATDLIDAFFAAQEPKAALDDHTDEHDPLIASGGIGTAIPNPASSAAPDSGEMPEDKEDYKILTAWIKVNDPNKPALREPVKCIRLTTYERLERAYALSLREREDEACICKGNWRQIVKECEGLIGKRFGNKQGEEFTFFGIVHGDDDYYYGMSGKSGLRLLSCVGDIAGHGFEPLADATSAGEEER